VDKRRTRSKEKSKSLLLEYEVGFRKKAKETQHVSKNKAFEIPRIYVCCLARYFAFAEKKESGL